MSMVDPPGGVALCLSGGGYRTMLLHRVDPALPAPGGFPYPAAGVGTA